MADTRLACAVCLNGCSGSLLAVMLLGPVALQLRALLCIVLPLCLGICGVCRGLADRGVCALPSGCRGRHSLLLFLDGTLALGCFLPALGVIQLHLLGAEPVARFACFGANAAQAIFHRKLFVAGGFISLARGSQRLAFVADAVVLRPAVRNLSGQCAVRRSIGGLGPNRGHWQHQQGGKRRCKTSTLHHVSPVSTMRRSRSRNSLDCISLRRDTVRGNSCASGPSV